MQPARYKAAYGGRGGAKSHFFAEQIILRCYRKKTRVVCIREVQATIKDSVRQLLIDKIQKLGLGSFFDVQESEIRAPNGSFIIFKGMQSYNAENIKSLEDFDIAWVEEAQTLSGLSLRLLRPTIRKAGSEIWASWNPRHEVDAIDKFFRGGAPPSNAVIVEVNWRDNPWFPEVLKEEMENDKANDPEMAEHVWEGGYEIISEASYYAKLLFKSEKEGRIGYFPYDPTVPVLTAWDIGVDDYTAVWFVQEFGYRAVVIDYWETSNEGAQQIVPQCMPELTYDDAAKTAQMQQIDREDGFVYGKHYFPHDVMKREWSAGGRTILSTLKELDVKPIHVGARLGPEERINATRKLLPVMYFHDTKRVRVGISRLRRYSRRWNKVIETYGEPLHDENSHGADAFGEYALNCRFTNELIGPKQPPKPTELVYTARPDGSVESNMSVQEAVDAMVKRRRNR